MSRYCLFPIALSVCATWGGGSACFEGGGESGSSFVIVDYGPVGAVKGKMERKFDLRLYAKDGAALSQNGPVVAQSNLADVLCTIQQAVLDANNWGYTRRGNRLVITSHTDKNGRRSPISKVVITAVQNLRPEELPTVIASENVIVERDAGAPARKP